MIRSILIGAVAGMRSITPLAAVTAAAARGRLPEDDRATRLIGHPLVVVGAALFAAAELGGDKMKTAPERIVLLGLIARIGSGAIAAAALAPRDRRITAALLGASAAVISSWPTWAVRTEAMDRYGQTLTGLIEDGIALAGAYAVTHDARGAVPAAA